MTKYMLLKSFLALFILSSFSCGKKDDRKVTPKSASQQTQTTKVSSSDGTAAQTTENTAQSSDSTIKITQNSSADSTKVVITSADNSVALSADASKQVSSDTTIVVQKNSQDGTKAQTKESVSVPVVNGAAQGKPAVSEISEAEKTAVLKVKVVNQKLLAEILNQTNQVVYKSKVTPLEQALVDLKKGDEDSFCSISGDIDFVSKKMVAITAIDKKIVDQDADVFETEITLMSQNKKSLLKCTHTTSNFYIEQFAINMSKYFEVWNDTQKMTTAGFKNPRTENRKLNAVKIKNLKMLQQASALEDRKALVSGRLVSEVESLELLKTGKERTACVVSEISKDLGVSKIYIRVDKMMGPDKYAEVIEQHTIYRADKDNYFVLQCLMTKKTSEWYDLMTVGKGVLEFGVLHRNEYNKMYDEVKALNDKLKNEN